MQRAPDLMLAIKAGMDENDEPGRFLLTRSANLATIPRIADSLAGRMAVTPLLPLAQAKIRSNPGRMLDRLFAGEDPAIEEDVVLGGEMMSMVLAGGYPEVVIVSCVDSSCMITTA